MSIPTTIRVPFVYVEFDESRAYSGPALLKYKVLILAERLSTGTKAVNEISAVTSADQAATYFGAGSVIHRMFQAWFQNNKLVEVFGQGIEEATGNKAAASIVFTGTATAAGTVYAYIDGTTIQVAVESGDAAADVSSALATAIIAVTSLPVTCDGTTTPGTAVVTCRTNGTVGNELDIRLNYNDGEELPAGITAVVAGSGHQATLSGGTGTPDWSSTSPLSSWGDTWFNIIIGSVKDATNMTLIETELADRFGALRMIDGIYISSQRGTLSGLASYGNGRNSPHVIMLENGGKLGVGGPTSSWWIAAGAGGRIATEAEIDPARPFQTLQIIGALQPDITEQFTLAERNTLLYDGIATIRPSSGGAVQIERAITMYQTNAAGAADIAYLNSNTLFTLMYIRYDWRNIILTKYPRAKLANDGVMVAPGQQIMTPSVGRAEAIARARTWEFLGLVENIDQFKQDLVVTRSISDPDRLDFLLPPDLINQLRVVGSTIQFLLESPTI